MQLIPVIDLMAGQVVRGVRGERSAYRPIRSSLCESSAPLDLAPRLLARAASDTLYIANLDALKDNELQFDILTALLERLPAVQLWVDGGFRDAESIEAFRQRLGTRADRVTPIVASESLPDADTARDVTGYVRGTITPLGATTAWPVIADASIVGRRISVGGGAAGVGITVDADALIEALHADIADLMD